MSTSVYILCKKKTPNKT